MKILYDVEEIWKTIPNSDNMYEISNFGRIKSLKGKNNSQRILKPSINSKGYYSFGVSINGETKTFLLHIILAELFIPNPNNLPCINHKDGIKTNIKLNNLEWCSYSYNTLHSYKLGLQKPNKNRLKIISKEVIDLETGIIFNSAKEAAFAKNINYNTLMCRLNGNIKNTTSLRYLDENII